MIKKLILLASFVTVNAYAQTVPSSCTGAAPANASIFGQTWHMQMSDNGINFLMAIQVTQNNVSLTNTCSLPDGTSLSVSTSAPAIVTANQVQILQDTQNETDSGSYSCTATLSAGAFTYSFSGNCLEMNSNGQIGYLTP